MIKKQVKNNFDDCYYIFQDGSVFSSLSERYLKPTQHNYVLKTVDGKYKKISLKKLYKLVFNKIFCIDTIQNLPNEQWKQIEGTDGNYYVSNKGRIKSYCEYNAKILSPVKNQRGYLRVDIYNKYGHRTMLVSRLVAAAFLVTPQNIDNYDLHHKDLNKLNNSVQNLIWLTKQEHYLLHYKAQQQEKNTPCKQQKTKK